MEQDNNQEKLINVETDKRTEKANKREPNPRPMNKIFEGVKPTKKKSHVWEDMAKNGQSTKTITFMVKAFINIVAFCCTLLCSFVVVVYFIYRY